MAFSQTPPHSEQSHLYDEQQYAPALLYEYQIAFPDTSTTLHCIQYASLENPFFQKPSTPAVFARLQENCRLFLALARERGLNTGSSKDSAVIPVILGNSLHCLQLSKAMLTRGVNVMPILHPAVEESAARLRYFITLLHTEQQIRHTIDVMVEELERISPECLSQVPSSEAAAS